MFGSVAKWTGDFIWLDKVCVQWESACVCTRVCLCTALNDKRTDYALTLLVDKHPLHKDKLFFDSWILSVEPFEVLTYCHELALKQLFIRIEFEFATDTWKRPEYLTDEDEDTSPNVNNVNKLNAAARSLNLLQSN